MAKACISRPLEQVVFPKMLHSPLGMADGSHLQEAWSYLLRSSKTELDNSVGRKKKQQQQQPNTTIV